MKWFKKKNYRYPHLKLKSELMSRWLKERAALDEKLEKRAQKSFFKMLERFYKKPLKGQSTQDPLVAKKAEDYGLVVVFYRNYHCSDYWGIRLPDWRTEKV